MSVARGVAVVALGVGLGWWLHPGPAPQTPTIVFRDVVQPDRTEALLRWWLYNDARWNLEEIEAAERDAR